MSNELGNDVLLLDESKALHPWSLGARNRGIPPKRPLQARAAPRPARAKPATSSHLPQARSAPQSELRVTPSASKNSREAATVAIRLEPEPVHGRSRGIPFGQGRPQTAFAGAAQPVAPKPKSRGLSGDALKAEIQEIRKDLVRAELAFEKAGRENQPFQAQLDKFMDLLDGGRYSDELLTYHRGQNAQGQDISVQDIMDHNLECFQELEDYHAQAQTPVTVEALDQIGIKIAALVSRTAGTGQAYVTEGFLEDLSRLKQQARSYQSLDSAALERGRLLMKKNHKALDRQVNPGVFTKVASGLSALFKRAVSAITPLKSLDFNEASFGSGQYDVGGSLQHGNRGAVIYDMPQRHEEYPMPVAA